MEPKYIVTTKECFYTKDSSLKNACWGKIDFHDNNIYIGENGKQVITTIENVIAKVRCDEKPVQSNDLGFPEDIESELNIYIAE